MTLRTYSLLFFACAIFCAGGLWARPGGFVFDENPRWLKGQSETPAREKPAGHTSETRRFRETGIGEFGVNWAIFSTTRGYNVTDIRGLDHPWSARYMASLDFWGFGGAAIVDYRLTPDWRITTTYRVDAAYGIVNQSRHETHSLQTLPVKRNYRGSYDQQKLSLNLSFEFAARWRYMWIIADFDGLLAFRRIDIRAYDTDFEDNQLGRLDLIKDRKRVDWDHIYKLGAGIGVGFEWFFVDEYARFVTVLMWRPWTWVTYRGASGFTNGLEFIMRSAPFELSNHIGVYFEFSVQMYLPVPREFNQIYYSQFSIGVRFK